MKMNQLLFESLKKEGADLVSSCDLSDLPQNIRSNLDTGISIAVKLNPDVVSKISAGPTNEYHAEYDRVNNILESLGQCAFELLKENGYEAIHLAVTDFGIDPETISTQLPHKTIATKSGIGWIGKNALLVTKEFGTAVRLTTVLTNAKLPDSAPVEKSSCGDCMECCNACPGNAPKGENWELGKYRDKFFDAWVCRKAALDQSISKTGIENTICGICIAACPWTKKYIKKPSDNLL